MRTRTTTPDSISESSAIGTTSSSWPITKLDISWELGMSVCSEIHRQPWPPLWALIPIRAAITPSPIPKVAVVAGA